MARPSTGDVAFSVVNVTILAVIALITVFPLYYVFVVSFTDPAEYYAKNGLIWFPSKWTLVSYEYLFSTNAFLRAINVSAFLAIVGTLCSLLVTSSFAYGLSLKRIVGRRILLIGVVFTTLFNPGFIPLYLLVRELGLINNLWSLILPVLTSGWYVILMKGFFDSIPESLEEAARIDGCNDIVAWYKIVLPLSLSSLAAFGLFYAVAYWNTFFHAILYMNDFEKWPLQVLLQNMLIESSTQAGGDAALQLMEEQDIPAETLKMAAVIVATVPILLVYPFLQKHFAKGVMLGSIKG